MARFTGSRPARKMDWDMLKKKLEVHLLNTVGSRLPDEQMNEIDSEIDTIFDKVYAHPDKMTTLVKDGYDGRLSNLWISVVANEDFIPELKLFLDSVEIKPTFNVASLASGLSVYELFLAKEFFPEGEMTCIDASIEMNKIANQFINKTNRENMKTVISSATNLPLGNETQDLVLARRTGLSNDENWNVVLDESYRVLKKHDDSRLIITVDKVFNKSNEDVKSDLNKSNFELVEIKDFERRVNEPIVSMIIAKPIKR